MALTDANAERTFISTRGAEAYGSVDAFDSVNPEKQDVVHMSGYTLVHHTADALLALRKERLNIASLLQYSILLR